MRQNTDWGIVPVIARYSRRGEALRLMTAHRILIATAVVFFLGYALWEAQGIPSGRGAGSRAALAGAGALILGTYLRSLRGK